MEKDFGHLFIPFISSHFFSETDFEQYLFKHNNIDSTRLQYLSLINFNARTIKNIVSSAIGNCSTVIEILCANNTTLAHNTCCFLSLFIHSDFTVAVLDKHHISVQLSPMRVKELANHSLPYLSAKLQTN